jgi:hypothetical protein
VTDHRASAFARRIRSSTVSPPLKPTDFTSWMRCLRLSGVAAMKCRNAAVTATHVSFPFNPESSRKDSNAARIVSGR